MSGHHAAHYLIAAALAAALLVTVLWLSGHVVSSAPPWALQ